MGLLDSLKSWLSSEASEAADVGRNTKGRLEADLDRREAELAATPAERMEQLQAKIAEGDDSFDDLRSKIEGRELKAEAVSEVAEIDAEAAGATDAIVDAVIVEPDSVEPDRVEADDAEGADKPES